MQSLAVNPALSQLLRVQAGGKLRRLRRGFSSRRRMLLTLMAVVLAVVWLGNAVATVLLRDAFDPQDLRRNTSLLLLLYFVWHLVRVAYKRPEEAIEWSPAEREFLGGGPFTRRELLAYRLALVLTATIPKALVAALLLTPDLPMWWSGFAGILLGLVLLEYVRVGLEIWACGVNGRTYLAWRVAVLGGLGVLAGLGFWRALQAFEANYVQGKTVWLHLFAWWGGALDAFRETWFGELLEFPFATMVGVMMAPGMGPSLLGNLGLALAFVLVAGYTAVRLDEWFGAKAVAAERASYGRSGAAVSSSDAVPDERVRLPRVPRLRGAGPLCWRQLKGVRRHRFSVAIALLIPGMMACLPLTTPGRPVTTFLSVVASALFYSFLLLPAALKFDFRSDFDRLPMLKMHPAPVPALVIGQIATPILLMTVYQIAVMLVAALARPVPPGVIGLSILLVLPVNVFFVALDNLIFLLYPHRQSQEGLEVFLRSTLTFTGKTLIFAFGYVLVSGWVFAARRLAAATGDAERFQLLFLPGALTMAVASAGLVLVLLIRTFEQYDPSAEGGA